MADQFKRQVAKKLRVEDALGGSFIKGQGTELSYVLGDNNEEISRVNIIATLVSMDNPGSFVIDDGTGRITVRSFDDYIKDDISLGDPLVILGKLREFSEERYIVPEIVKKIKDTRWIEVRNKELSSKVNQTVSKDINTPNEIVVKEEPPVPIDHIEPVHEESTSEQDISEIEIDDTLNRSDVVYELIKKMDKGDGASTDEVINKSGDSGTEKIITNLLKEGDIFEIAPGKLKVLE